MNKQFFIFVLALLFSGYTTQAQYKKKKRNDVDKIVWKTNDPAKKIKYNVEDYKNAPAIIIYEKSFYNYNKRGVKIYYEHYFRRRIKILDKATLKDYSEFKLHKELYRPNVTNNIYINKFNIRIIKANGKRIRINIKKFTVKDGDKRTLVIPNLEVGDIVDYYYYNFEREKKLYGKNFPFVQLELNSRFPIIKKEIEINVGKRFYLNFNNYKGAPDLIKLKSKKSNQNKYLLTLNNIKQRDAKHWIFPFVAYPHIKFQVYFVPAERKKKLLNGFLSDGKGGDLKRKVTKEEVLQTYKNIFTFNKDIFSINNEVKSLYKQITEKTNKNKVLELYKILRDTSIVYIENYYYAGRALGEDAYRQYYPSYYSNQNRFVAVMADYLHRNNIPYKIILAKSRKNGNIDDLLIRNLLMPILKIKVAKNEYLYIEPLNHNSVNHSLNKSGNIDPYFEGATGYLLQPDKKGRIVNIKKTTLPISDAKKNVVEKKINLSFDDYLKKINIERNIEASPGIKEIYQLKVLSPSDIYYDSFIKANPKKTKKKRHRRRRISSKKIKLKKSRKKAYDSYKKKIRQKNIEYLKKYEEDIYNIKISDYDYGIDNSGRYYNKPNFIYHDSFVVNDGLIKKAGKNFIFKIGKLIGEQLKIDEKERKRSEDIYKKRTSTIINRITIKIPDGYTIKGLDKLNMSVINEVGSFESSAKIEGNKLIVIVKEAYFNIFEPNANWQKMLDVLDASYQFTQSKVLIKK